MSHIPPVTPCIPCVYVDWLLAGFFSVLHSFCLRTLYGMCSWWRFVKEANKGQTTPTNCRDVLQRGVCLIPSHKYEDVISSRLDSVEISCAIPGTVTCSGYFSPDNIQTHMLVHYPPFEPKDGSNSLLRSVGIYNPIRKRRRVTENRNFRWSSGCSISFVVALLWLHLTAIFRRNKV